MPIPDFQSTMRPLLEAVSDGQSHSLRQVTEAVIKHFQLTPEEAQEKIASGSQTLIKNRVSWARTYLTKAGLLTSPARGCTQITQRGLNAIAQTEHPIKTSYLQQFPEFVAFYNTKSTARSGDNPAVEEGITTPEERLAEAAIELNKTLIDELLTIIKASAPEFFEQLVVDLMFAMGYGGWSKRSGAATQYTADGGVDGIINEDPLGLEVIYLQAKRYTSATVGRPDVQAFAGALDMRRAKKGVFIATSKFSKEATEYVGMIDKVAGQPLWTTYGCPQG